MTAEITPLIAGNWKMNGTTASLGEVQKLASLLAQGGGPRCTVVICPPSTLLERLNELASPAGIVTGGQDCHPAASGAHTGDVSAQMLSDAGAQYVIVGHSERRTNHGETDELVQLKALAAHAAGLVPIICVGEPRPSAMPARRRASSRPSSPGPFPTIGRGIRSSSPMSPSGPSVPAARPAQLTSLRCTTPSAPAW